MVALHLDNKTGNAYLCNQGVTASTFLSRLAYHILNLADIDGIYLLPVYMPTYLNMDVAYLSQQMLVPGWYLLPYIAEAAFYLWGELEVDLLAALCTNHCLHCYTLENAPPLGALGLNASTIWDIQVSYVFLPSALVPWFFPHYWQSMPQINSDFLF